MIWAVPDMFGYYDAGAIILVALVVVALSWFWREWGDLEDDQPIPYPEDSGEDGE
jgi:hypothetical protein